MKPPLRVPLFDLKAGTTTLPAEVARYVTRVHRVRAGQRLLVFDPAQGSEADAVLVADDGRTVPVEVASPRQAPDLSMPVTLLVGLGKADKPEQAVRDATVLGARRLIFVRSERSIAKLLGSRRGERFSRVAVEAARQCGRGNLPLIEGPVSWEGVLAEFSSMGDDLRFVAALTGSVQPLVRRLSHWSPVAPRSATLLIGPEGGLADREVSEACERRFEAVTLARHVLRTETAVTVGLGVFAACWATGS